MQQLVGIGRNEPCPCGSGRKYKKCCLGAQQDAVKGKAGELEVAALVDEVIELDDWRALDPLVDRAMAFFEKGEPLEHVRFRDDLLLRWGGDDAELTKLCPAGWLQRCELELARVLEGYALEAGERDALRMAVHLVRRFGAQSPIVEELARLQLDERRGQMRRLANVQAQLGIARDDIFVGISELGDWIERAAPPVLTFADWFALRCAPKERRGEVWASGVAIRVCEACLDRLEASVLDDRREWAQLAAIAMMSAVPPVGELLVTFAALRDPTADERLVHEVFRKERALEELRGAIMPRIIDATEGRGDHAGAALLRETMRMLQKVRRGPVAAG